MKYKILFIQEFGDAVPSGKIRGNIYKQEIEKYNVKILFINRNNQFFISILTNQKRILIKLMLRLLNHSYKYFKSIYILLISLYFDAIWLNKVLSPRFIKTLRFINKFKIINLDVVDNPYEIDINWAKSLKYLTSITTDNKYNRQRLLQFSTNVNIIPDYPLLDKFQKNNFEKESSNFIFGWVGSKSSYYLLHEIRIEILQFLKNTPDAKFYILGSDFDADLSLNSRIVCIPSYNEDLMINIIGKLHVGIFPLDNSLASEVRGVLKATLYMAGSAVVLANPIGEINDLIIDNFNGVLINTKSDWYDKLKYLRNNRSLLSTISRNGYSSVMTNYSLEFNTKKILNILGYNECFE